jgi:hypothetical protein
MLELVYWVLKEKRKENLNIGQTYNINNFSIYIMTGKTCVEERNRICKLFSRDKKENDDSQSENDENNPYSLNYSKERCSKKNLMKNNEKSSPSVLLLSIGVGGIGLSLVGATRVF